MAAKDLDAMAERVAESLLRVSEAAKDNELTRLKGEDTALHALVKSKLENRRNDSMRR